MYETKVFDVDGDCFLTIGYAFVLNIGESPDFAFLSKAPDTAGSFEFVKCNFGAQGTGKAARVTTEFSMVQEDLFGVRSEGSGVSVLNLVSDSPPKDRPKRTQKKKMSYVALKSKIEYGIHQKQLSVHKTYAVDGKSYKVFVGQDDWFIANGFPPADLTEVVREELRIIELKPSESKVGQHVIAVQLD